jgi:hypothetical protein
MQQLTQNVYRFFCRAKEKQFVGSNPAYAKFEKKTIIN